MIEITSLVLVALVLLAHLRPIPRPEPKPELENPLGAEFTRQVRSLDGTPLAGSQPEGTCIFVEYVLKTTHGLARNP
jgi:hypothetical protein